MAKEPEDPKNDARVTVYLPSDLLRRVKVKAAEDGKRPNTVIVEILEAAFGGSAEP